jgi:hypothetical protein
VFGETAYLNGPLAAHYGVEGVTGDAFQLVAAPERSGILLQGWSLVKGSGTTQTSPIKRGYFALSRVLCVPFGDPPAGAAGALADVDPADSTREQIESITGSDSCQTCHQHINAVGFALEPLGPFAQWRTMEGQHPIDGAVDLGPLGLGGAIDGPIALSKALAASPQVEACGVSWLYRWIKGQAPGTSDARVVAAIQESGRGFVDQLLAYVVSDDFIHVKNPGATP